MFSLYFRKPTKWKKLSQVGADHWPASLSSCRVKLILMRGRPKKTESQAVLFFIFLPTLITFGGLLSMDVQVMIWRQTYPHKRPLLQYITLNMDLKNYLQLLSEAGDSRPSADCPIKSSWKMFENVLEKGKISCYPLVGNKCESPPYPHQTPTDHHPYPDHESR